MEKLVSVMQYNDDKIILSICCLTYNHENYIRDAIEGFLMQKVNFPIEIIIHDDASTDHTTEIIKEYEKKYPSLIKPIYQKENQYSKGIKPSPTYTWPKAKGKYIALCEGDDYWTNSLKLQKQVDFMEANEDCSLCYHLAVTTYTDNSKEDTIFGPKGITEPAKFDTHELIKSTNALGITTASMVFRTVLIKDLPDYMFKIPTGDIGLKFFCGCKGKLGFIGQNPMSLHRRATPGSWSAGLHSKDWHLQRIRNLYFQWNLFDEYSGFKYTKEIHKANKRKEANILCQMSIYCSRKEIAGLLARNVNILPYFKLKAIIVILARLILGKQNYNQFLNWIRTRENS